MLSCLRRVYPDGLPEYWDEEKEEARESRAVLLDRRDRSSAIPSHWKRTWSKQERTRRRQALREGDLRTAEAPRRRTSLYDYL